MERLLTIQEVASLLGKSPKTIRGYMAERGLGYLQPFPRGPIWFRPSEVERWLRGRQRKLEIVRQIK